VVDIKVIFVIMFFILGTCLGSFYNVLGLRVPNKESIIKPKSHCPNCHHELSWLELIPIISYLLLKGKCKNCHEKISVLYPLNELFCGVLFAVSFYSWGFSLELIVALSISSLLCMVIASDLTYLVIPDGFIITVGLIVAIVRFIQYGLYDGLVCLAFGVLSFALMYLIMVFGSKVFHKEAMGGADVKLMFVVGLVTAPILSKVTTGELFLNILMPLFVIVIASILALPSSLYLYVKQRENVIPFGPFLVVGLLIVYFTKVDIKDVFMFLLGRK